MTIFTSKDKTRDRLADEIAGLRREIAGLREERDRTAEVNDLHREIETLKLEKANLIEDNAREIRETEHKVGLLRTQQEHEVANAKRETMLAVREENLAADQKRFKDEMDFQREHLQREVTRVEGILVKVLDRLPSIDVALSGDAAPKAPAASPRKGRAGT